jgi:hypothetical protein
MQLFAGANVNRISIGGKLLSYSETFASHPSGHIEENPWNSRQAIEKQAIIPRPDSPKMGILWAFVYGASVHDIWCKPGTKLRKKPSANSTEN